MNDSPLRQSEFLPTPSLAPWQMSDSTRVYVRPLSASDRKLEVAFLQSLSERTKYLRMMTPLRHVSPELLTQLMDVDGHDRAALVATVHVNEQEVFIAVARYAVTGDPTTAEIAITVADAWQHRGVATRLLAQLILHAQRHGIARLVGLVLPDNVAMLSLAREFGAEMHFDADDRLITFSIDTSILGGRRVWRICNEVERRES